MNKRLNFADFKRDYTLPSPRGVGLTIMRLCQREHVALEELARVISSDPVLTGQVIRFGNVINPNPNRRIAAVTVELLILIGVSVVRQIAMGLSLVAAYRSGPCARFDYERFWTRSLGIACFSHAAGQRVRVAPPAELFASGLLSDIGRLGLATARPRAYGELLDRHAREPGLDLAMLEAETLGMSHNALSAAMMEDWRMPGLFCDAVEFHERPDSTPFEAGSRQQRVTQLFHLAARLADFCLAPSEQRESSWPAIVAYATDLGVEASELLTHGVQEWRQWSEFLGLDPSSVAEDILPPACAA